ncbi:MAG: hypothetical protein LN416_01770 [Candidatus Thermoplasmatota archaeon]|nr:hypothetical protein [Candidatus Thermoplasmatota archaeon]
MTPTRSRPDSDDEGARISQETFEAVLEDFERSGRGALSRDGAPRFTDAENVEWLRRRMGGLDYRHAARVMEQIQREVPHRGRVRRRASGSHREGVADG